MESMHTYRRFLKSDRWDEWHKIEADQNKRIPPPAAQKPCPEGTATVPLVDPNDLTIGRVALADAIRRRKSHRRFTTDPLTLEELSFLLWATQGVQDVTLTGTRRTVPSAGSRHPFETYLGVNRVAGLQDGLYRFLPLDNALCTLRLDASLGSRLIDGCRGQRFVGRRPSCSSGPSFPTGPSGATPPSPTK